MKTILIFISLFLLLAIAYASDAEDELEDDEFEDMLLPRMAARWLRRRRGRPGRGRRRGPVGGGVKKRKCPTIRFKCGNMRRVCLNMRNAIRRGKPKMLNRITSESKIDQNRRNACKKFKKSGKNNSCDEYPFASTRQGGRGAVILAVPLNENRSQGGQLKNFYQKNNIKNGGCFQVQV